MTPQIDEFFVSVCVGPERMDELWAAGWRHFGPVFFRYSSAMHGTRAVRVLPLRIELDCFQLSKSQQRVLRGNADLILKVQPTVIDEKRRRLFELHKLRFKENVPGALEEFLGVTPASSPCNNVEVALFAGERLLAASFLDLGRTAASSIYGIFDPAEARRSLGIATMLWEIHYARERGLRYYYPGYAFDEPSPYDYKKRFAGLHCYDWQGNWQPLTQSA